jgi:hypothetical protein
MVNRLNRPLGNSPAGARQGTSLRWPLLVVMTCADLLRPRSRSRVRRHRLPVMAGHAEVRNFLASGAFGNGPPGGARR